MIDLGTLELRLIQLPLVH